MSRWLVLQSRVALVEPGGLRDLGAPPRGAYLVSHDHRLARAKHILLDLGDAIEVDSRNLGIEVETDGRLWAADNVCLEIQTVVDVLTMAQAKRDGDMKASEQPQRYLLLQFDKAWVHITGSYTFLRDALPSRTGHHWTTLPRQKCSNSTPMCHRSLVVLAMISRAPNLD